MDKPSESKGPSFQVSDRRFWVDDESAVERAEAAGPRFPSYIEELKARTEAAEQKLKERLEQLDEENAAYRKRLDRQLEVRFDAVKQQLFLDLLEVVDNLELALSAASDTPPREGLHSGIQLNLDILRNKLKAYGVEAIENLNLPFEPAESEAISTVPVSEPELDNVIVDVVRKGFRIGDKVLRPAIVRVGTYRR